MINKGVFKNYPNKTFLETGAYLGDGIAQALETFENVISIEIADKFLDFCKDRFTGNSRVNLIKGDSCEVLGEVIKNIYHPITFWLDGHYSGGDMPTGKHLSPLIQELDQIKDHPVKNHNILIDDCHCWSEMNNNFHEGFNLKMIEEKIKEINPEYTIKYISGVNDKGKEIPNDILTATV